MLMVILIASTIIYAASLSCLAVCAHKGGATLLFKLDTVPLSKEQKSDREVVKDAIFFWVIFSIFCLVISGQEFDLKIAIQILLWSNIACYIIVRNYFSDSSQLIGVRFLDTGNGAYVD